MPSLLCSTWNSPGGFEGLEPFPLSLFPAYSPWVAGIRLAGPLVGGALLPSLGWPGFGAWRTLRKYVFLRIAKSAGLPVNYGHAIRE